MGIDRISKSGPSGTPVAPTAEPTADVRRTPANEAAPPFAVAPARRAAAVEPASTALERLRAGDIPFEHYLDLKVEEATAHLAQIPSAELDAVRRALRDRLVSDPMFVDLVKTSTGQMPRPADED